MALSRIVVAWLGVLALFLLAEAVSGRVLHRPGRWLHLSVQAAQALLLTLLGALWFASLGTGSWWLIFAAHGWAHGAVGGDERCQAAEAVGLARTDASRPRGRASARGRRMAVLATGNRMTSTTAVIDRLALYFSEEQTRQGLLARAELGRPEPRRSRARLPDGRARGSAAPADGSVGGAPVTTIWRAHELLDLGSDPTAAPLALVLRWMMELQDKPGGFGEGCDRERHSRRLCEHFVVGFFAPAPPELRLAPGHPSQRQGLSRGARRALCAQLSGAARRPAGRPPRPVRPCAAT